MKTFADLLCLAFVVCFIVDLSGGVQTLKSWLKVERLAPLDCSLCMTFWAGLAYLLISGRFAFAPLVWVCVLALCASVLSSILSLVREFLVREVSRLTLLIYKK